MAKRKRLTPAQGIVSGLEASAGVGEGRPTAPSGGPLGGGSVRPPIAAQAGEAAALSALERLRGEWEAARAGGRMVISVPLEQIEAEHLVRDRVALDEEALGSLKESLRARGQQTPVEVVALEAGRFGLISGWRRLTALRQLAGETGEARFGQVLALVRQPVELADSYVAMVEENEIRADLSHYERARIVRRALEEGVFETEKQALQRLFASASYARRSKIKSFLAVVDALEGHLRFPAAMTERTGLALAKALEAPGMMARLRAALAQADPRTAEAEATCLLAATKVPQTQAQTRASGQKTVQDTAQDIEPAAVRLVTRKGKVELSGAGVTPDFVARLEAWLRQQDVTDARK